MNAAEIELNKTIEDVRKKYKVKRADMVYILGQIAENYKIQDTAEKAL